MWSDCHDRRKSTRLARRKYKFPKVAPFRERARIQLTARKWPRRYTKITGGVSGSIISLHPSQDLRAYQGVHATRSTAKCISTPLYRYILISGDVPAAFDPFLLDSLSSCAITVRGYRACRHHRGRRPVAGSSPFFASFECCYPALGRSFYSRNVEYIDSSREVSRAWNIIYPWFLCIGLFVCDFLRDGGISGEIRQMKIRIRMENWDVRIFETRRTLYFLIACSR